MRLKLRTHLVTATAIAIHSLLLQGCEEYEQGSVRIRPLREIPATDSLSITGNAGNALTRVGSFFLIANNENPGEIQVVDSLGGFVRTLGRQGEGPEEFAYIQDVTTGADGSVWILDLDNARLSHYTPTLDYLGDHPISLSPPRAMGYGLEPLANGDLLLLGCISTSDNCGVHRWNPSGLVWSTPLESITGGVLFVAAEAPDGTLWVAKQSTYELWELAPSGTLLRSVQLSPDWWADWQVERQASGSPPAEALEDGGPASVWRPKARVFDIACTDKHLLVLGATGDLGWQDSRSEGYINLGKSRDSVVEVLDRRTLAAIALGTFDIPHGILKRFLSPNLLLAEETHEVFDRLSLWSLEGFVN